MAITTEQREQIINWVNSNDFNTVLKEIIEHCVTSAEIYCLMNSRGDNLSKNYIKTEALVNDFFLTAKIPFVHSPSMTIYIADVVLKKYGSLLDKKIYEQLRISNIQTDF